MTWKLPTDLYHVPHFWPAKFGQKESEDGYWCKADALAVLDTVRSCFDKQFLVAIYQQNKKHI